MTKTAILSLGLPAFALLSALCVMKNLGPISETLAVAPIAKPASTLTVEQGTDGVTLRGRIPSEAAHKAILANAAIAFAPRSIDDKMVISEGLTEARWANASKALMGLIAVNVGDARLVFRNDSIFVHGTVESREAKSTLLINARAASVGSVLIDEITIVPRKAIVTAQENIDAILADHVVEFQTGSALLTPTGKATLDQLLPHLQKADSPFEIQGHTDSQGNPDRNKILSLDRSNAVMKYLVSRGVPASRITAQGFGSNVPKVAGDDVSAMQRNRRVEFKLY